MSRDRVSSKHSQRGERPNMDVRAEVYQSY
jgi:hypothetical protein